MEDPPPREITELLARFEQGGESGAPLLLPQVHDQLRALAGSFFRRVALRVLGTR